MKDTHFAFSVAYMRTMENKMLGQSDIDALLNMSDAGEAIKYLSDRNYGSMERKGGEGKQEIDDMLKAEQELAWQEIREACPKGAPIDVLLYQNDFQNLKTILKAFFSKSNWEDLMIYPSTVDTALIYRAIAENEMDELPLLLQKPAKDAYEVLARTNDGQRAEVILDKAAFRAMKKTAEEHKNKFLLQWVELWATLLNMKMLLRGTLQHKDKAFLAEAMLPTDDINSSYMVDAAAQDKQALLQAFTEAGFEDGAEAAGRSMSEFEKWSDNKLMDFVKDAKNSSFGFEPLVAFLFGKKAELQAVRIVLYGLLNHIPKNILKERLRDMYV